MCSCKLLKILFEKPISLNSIDMNIVVNTRTHEFKCVENHYLLIYGLKKNYK